MAKHCTRSDHLPRADLSKLNFQLGLGFFGQIGNGLLYMLARSADWGHAAVQTATEDYGTKFIVVAGLLNIVAAVDAHSLASGRKLS